MINIFSYRGLGPVGAHWAKPRKTVLSLKNSSQTRASPILQTTTLSFLRVRATGGGYLLQHGGIACATVLCILTIGHSFVAIVSPLVLYFI